MAKLVNQVMDPDPATVHIDEDARAVAELLGRRNLHGVPVLDGDDRVVGIVTENDLVISEGGSELRLPHFVDILGGIVFLEPFRAFEERLRKAVADRVADLMTPDPVTCSPDDPVRVAARKIAERHHNLLPVVDADGRIAGVVTRADVVAALVAEE